MLGNKGKREKEKLKTFKAIGRWMVEGGMAGEGGFSGEEQGGSVSTQSPSFVLLYE